RTNNVVATLFCASTVSVCGCELSISMLSELIANSSAKDLSARSVSPPTSAPAITRISFPGIFDDVMALLSFIPPQRSLCSRCRTSARNGEVLGYVNPDRIALGFVLPENLHFVKRQFEELAFSLTLPEGNQL